MFKNIRYIESFNVMLKYLESDERYLLLVAENSEFEVSKLPVNKSIVGAIFTRLIFENRSYNKGFILAQMSENTSAFFVKDISKELEIKHLDKLNSFFLIVDGLSPDTSTFIEDFFEEVNEECKILGGGAGKLTLQQEPVVFQGNDIRENAALVVGSYDTIGVGVKHGWEEIEGPFIVTDSTKCELKKINYMDAFNLYKQVVEKDSGKEFNDDNFFEIAKGYPFGITRYFKETIVRDPILTDGKSMTLVGNMDVNSVISILKGENENLIQAASDASKVSIENAKKRVSSALIVDCISRFLFLEDDFEKELQAIKYPLPENSLIWGVLSLGEIANANQENIEFYNKTCVVGAL